MRVGEGLDGLPLVARGQVGADVERGLWSRVASESQASSAIRIVHATDSLKSCRALSPQDQRMLKIRALTDPGLEVEWPVLGEFATSVSGRRSSASPGCGLRQVDPQLDLLELRDFRVVAEAVQGSLGDLVPVAHYEPALDVEHIFLDHHSNAQLPDLHDLRGVRGVGHLRGFESFQDTVVVLVPLLSEGIKCLLVGSANREELLEVQRGRKHSPTKHDHMIWGRIGRRVLVKHHLSHGLQAGNLLEEIPGHRWVPLQHGNLIRREALAGRHPIEQVIGNGNVANLREKGRSLVLPPIGQLQVSDDVLDKATDARCLAEGRRIGQGKNVGQDLDAPADRLLQEIAFHSKEAELLKGRIEAPT